MHIDLLIFQSAIVLSLLVFISPTKIKYNAIMLPITMLMVVSSWWSVEVLLQNNQMVHLLSFNISAQVFSFWSHLPRLIIDQLSAIFILMINAVALASFIYSKGYLSKYNSLKSHLGMSMHYFSMFLLYLCMILIPMLKDGFMFLFIWELMSLSTFVLVAFHGEKAHVMKAAINYLIQMHVGFLFLLAGFLLANKETGIWGFDALKSYFEANNNIPLFIIFFIGFGVKSGIMPFHTWLPKTYPSAPANATGLMSGAAINMGVYGMLRIASNLQSQFYEIGLIMLVISLISILLSISTAIFQHDIKKILAFSSIENMGIVVLGIAISVLGKAFNIQGLILLGLTGSILHIINHAIYKSMLFMLAGNIEKMTGSTEIGKLGGLIKKMPVTATFFLIGSIAICALPPLNGFVSEFIIYQGIFTSIASGNFFISVISIVAIIILSISAGLCFYAFSKAFGLTFLGTPRIDQTNLMPKLKPSMIFVGYWGTILILVLAFGSSWLIPEIGEAIVHFSYVPKSTTNSLIPENTLLNFGVLGGILITLIILLYLIRRSQQRKVDIQRGPSWGCGYDALDANHQYTPQSFSSPLNKVVSPLVEQKIDYQDYKEEEIFPSPRTFKTTQTDRIEKYIILKPVKYLLETVPKIGMAQTGRIQHYLIYPLAFLILIALLTAFTLI